MVLGSVCTLVYNLFIIVKYMLNTTLLTSVPDPTNTNVDCFQEKEGLVTFVTFAHSLQEFVKNQFM